jgi:hypothetical protein
MLRRRYVRPLRPLPDAQADELRALLAPRRHLVAMRTVEQNRLGSAPSRLQTDIQAPITWLNTRLSALVGVDPLNRDSGTLRGRQEDLGRARPRAGVGLLSAFVAYGRWRMPTPPGRT